MQSIPSVGGFGEFGPLLVPVADGFRAIGVGRTKGYELIGSGAIEAVKIGARTLLKVESLRRFAMSLPRACQTPAA
jgi:hypothetical protein